MSTGNGTQIAEAVRQIPRGLFIMTTAFGGARSGVLTRWVQPCSDEPLLVMVAIAQGLPVVPLIRDSRAFALCQISEGDTLLKRLFAAPHARGDDPFIALPAHVAPSGSPLIDRALAYLDCDVVRHVDLDTNYRLYVGQVRAGGINHPGRHPEVEVGETGPLSYPNSI